MVIRLLLIGSPQERAALKHSIRTGFGRDSVFKLEFDEFLRFSGATEHIDSSEFPNFIVTTPSAILEQAVELLRHVRGCGRTVPFVLWRRSTPDQDARAAIDAHSAKLVTSDDPLYVTAAIVTFMSANVPRSATEVEPANA